MLDMLLILFLSFTPMLVYAVVLWWLDRYEKEPLGLLVTAFLWGAIPSIILALIMQVVLDIPIVAVSANQLMYDLLGASVIAPLTEEGVKALALLLLLLVVRREIDSPIDGLIYGGVVGFGFAAVENVLYLVGAYTEGGIGDVWSLAFLRAGVFGLNHAMYTAFTGLGVALSLELEQKWLKPLPIVRPSHSFWQSSQIGVVCSYCSLLPWQPSSLSASASSSTAKPLWCPASFLLQK